MGAARRTAGYAIARPADCSQLAWLQSAARAAHIGSWGLAVDPVDYSRGACRYTVAALTIACRPYHRRGGKSELLSPDRSYSARLLRWRAIVGIGWIPQALERA